jgi:hypothetical protein
MASHSGSFDVQRPPANGSGWPVPSRERPATVMEPLHRSGDPWLKRVRCLEHSTTRWSRVRRMTPGECGEPMAEMMTIVIQGPATGNRRADHRHDPSAANGKIAETSVGGGDHSWFHRVHRGENCAVAVYLATRDDPPLRPPNRGGPYGSPAMSFCLAPNVLRAEAGKGTDVPVTDEPVIRGGPGYQLETVIGRGGMAEVLASPRNLLDSPGRVADSNGCRRIGHRQQLPMALPAGGARQLPALKTTRTSSASTTPGERTDPATGISVPYIVMETVEGTTPARPALAAGPP